MTRSTQGIITGAVLTAYVLASWFLIVFLSRTIKSLFGCSVYSDFRNAVLVQTPECTNFFDSSALFLSIVLVFGGGVVLYLFIRNYLKPPQSINPDPSQPDSDSFQVQ